MAFPLGGAALVGLFAPLVGIWAAQSAVRRFKTETLDPEVAIELEERWGRARPVLALHFVLTLVMAAIRGILTPLISPNFLYSVVSICFAISSLHEVLLAWNLFRAWKRLTTYIFGSLPEGRTHRSQESSSVEYSGVHGTSGVEDGSYGAPVTGVLVEASV